MNLNPFPALEAALYRRDVNNTMSLSPLDYHNHILQGCFLRYIKKRLRTKDVGKYRLVLVQGTRRGRLCSLRLHPGSIIQTATTTTDMFQRYSITVTGIDDSKSQSIFSTRKDVTWQLVFPSEDLQRQWLDSLHIAKDFSANWPNKDEISRLVDLARKMRSHVDPRRRIHRFKIYPRCFVSGHAVRWLMKYEGVSTSQATVLGQKMCSLGLISHITNEHAFCNKKLLFQFPATLDSYATSSFQGGRTDGSNPSLLSGWTDNDSSGSLNHAGSQSQSPMGSKQNVFFDHRTVVHDTMAHPDDSMLSTGTDVDVEDDSPLLSGIGMSSGELKQALYVSQEELSTMRVTQKSLRNSYRKLEPCVMELMQAYNHVNTQQFRSDVIMGVLQLLIWMVMIVYAVDASAATLLALFGGGSSGDSVSISRAGDGGSISRAGSDGPGVGSDDNSHAGDKMDVGGASSGIAGSLSWLSLMLWGGRGGGSSVGWDKDSIVWYMIVTAGVISLLAALHLRQGLGVMLYGKRNRAIHRFAKDIDMPVTQRVLRGMDQIRKVFNSANSNHFSNNNSGTSNFWSFWSLNSSSNNDNNGLKNSNDGKASFWNILFGENDDGAPSLDPELFRLLSEEDEGRESEAENDDGDGGVGYEGDSVDDDDDDDDESESGNESEDEEAESAPVGRVSKGGLASRSTSRGGSMQNLGPISTGSANNSHASSIAAAAAALHGIGPINTGADNDVCLADDGEDDEEEDDDEDGDDDDDVDDEEEIEDEDEGDGDCDGDDGVIQPNLSHLSLVNLLSSMGGGQTAMSHQWPNNPILVKRSPNMLCGDLSPADISTLNQPLTIHQSGQPELSEFLIESDLFVGKAYVVIADLPDSSHDHFRKTHNKLKCVFQGRFKRRVPFSSVYTGQALDEPVCHVPAKWLMGAGLKFMNKLQPALQVRLQGNKPYFLSPLATTAQKIVISRVGEEPSISYGIDQIEENMRILGRQFVDMRSQRRKAFFSKRDQLANFSYDPQYVYTFKFYQHRLNLATFKLDLGVIKYDLRKDMESDSNQAPWKYYWNVEIWHKRCVPRGLIQQQEQHQQQQQQQQQQRTDQGNNHNHSHSHSQKNTHINSSSSKSIYNSQKSVKVGDSGDLSSFTDEPTNPFRTVSVDWTPTTPSRATSDLSPTGGRGAQYSSTDSVNLHNPSSPSSGAGGAHLAGPSPCADALDLHVTTATSLPSSSPTPFYGKGGLNQHANIKNSLSVSQSYQSSPTNHTSSPLAIHSMDNNNHNNNNNNYNNSNNEEIDIDNNSDNNIDFFSTNATSAFPAVNIIDNDSHNHPSTPAHTVPSAPLSRSPSNSSSSAPWGHGHNTSHSPSSGRKNILQNSTIPPVATTDGNDNESALNPVHNGSPITKPRQFSSSPLDRSDGKSSASRKLQHDDNHNVQTAATTAAAVYGTKEEEHSHHGKATPPPSSPPPTPKKITSGLKGDHIQHTQHSNNAAGERKAGGEKDPLDGGVGGGSTRSPPAGYSPAAGDSGKKRTLAKRLLDSLLVKSPFKFSK